MEAKERLATVQDELWSHIKDAERHGVEVKVVYKYTSSIWSKEPIGVKVNVKYPNWTVLKSFSKLFKLMDDEKTMGEWYEQVQSFILDTAEQAKRQNAEKKAKEEQAERATWAVDEQMKALLSKKDYTEWLSADQKWSNIKRVLRVGETNIYRKVDWTQPYVEVNLRVFVSPKTALRIADAVKDELESAARGEEL